MKQIRFKEDSRDGEVMIMEVKGLDIRQIRLNKNSAEVTVVYKEIPKPAPMKKPKKR